jgi:hypothetical protein
MHSQNNIEQIFLKHVSQLHDDYFIVSLTGAHL